MKNLLSMIQGTAKNKFANKKITSTKSKRQKTDKLSLKKQKVQAIKPPKGLEKRGLHPEVGTRKIDNLKEDFKELQSKRNAVIEQVREDLFKNRRRDYNVLDDLGFLTMETTPYELFDSEEEVLNRMDFYSSIVDNGIQSLIDEATKGTSALIHMMDNTILYELDNDIRQNIIDRYEFASVEERMAFLSDAFKYVREYYEDMRSGFETLHGRQIAEDIVGLLNFRMENNSQQTVNELFNEMRH